MMKLSDTQLMVLSKAAAREDRLAVAPAKLSKAALAKVGTSLVARKLMREIRAKPGMPVWRVDAQGRGFSLMITRAGRRAIGVEEEIESGEDAVEQKGRGRKTNPAAPVRKAPPSFVETSSSKTPYDAKGRAGAAPDMGGTLRRASGAEALQLNARDEAGKAAGAHSSQRSGPPRTGSKQALVIGMLAGENGATLDALVVATGWLPHSVRAALTGLRKRGFAIERGKDEGDASVYRIAGAMAAA